MEDRGITEESVPAELELCSSDIPDQGAERARERGVYTALPSIPLPPLQLQRPLKKSWIHRQHPRPPLSHQLVSTRPKNFVKRRTKLYFSVHRHPALLRLSLCLVLDLLLCRNALELSVPVAQARALGRGRLLVGGIGIDDEAALGFGENDSRGGGWVVG